MVVKTHGEARSPPEGEKLWNHVDLVQLLDIVDLEKGVAVAGGRPAGWAGLGVPPSILNGRFEMNVGWVVSFRGGWREA